MQCCRCCGRGSWRIDSEGWQFSLCPLFLHAGDKCTSQRCCLLYCPVATCSEVCQGPDLEVNIVPEEPESPTQVSSETPSNGSLDGSVSLANTWQVLVSSDRV